jgi:hypothetical protein
LIVDAVEGFETWVGDKDAFGEARSRRSRIAQLLRTAVGKCHVIFLVEESESGIRAPEEFVTDVVLHVRYRAEQAYSRRTIEIEKVRGQTHARGEHDLIIRSGKGSFTGDMENPDDPRITAYIPTVNAGNQSYIYVFQSLHFQSRRYMEPQSTDGDSIYDFRKLPIYAGFGIRYLDNLLGRHSHKVRTQIVSPEAEQMIPGDPEGLPTDALTALIGETGTFKSVLGRAFLSQCFAPWKSEHDIALLLTTRETNRQDLRTRICWHLRKLSLEDLKDVPLERIFCRRLEVHHQTPSGLMHIIMRLIEKAQHTLFESLTHNSPIVDEFRQCFLEQQHQPAIDWHWGTFLESREFLDQSYQGIRKKYGWRLRFVLDNWSAIEETYPEIATDPLFLPFLLSHLRREGISSVIIATESGGPAQILSPPEPSKLRQLTPHHLLTWHVPFFGVNRVAITSVPPIGADRQVLVRELKSHAMTRSAQRRQQQESFSAAEREQLIVNPEFEVYAGLEDGDPHPIPLRVYLYLETNAFKSYVEEMNNLFRRLAVGAEQTDVITGEDAYQYERLREFSHLQSGRRLDHTLVFQVDEFWAESSIQLCDQYDYLWAETVRPDGTANVVEDPFRLFQPTKADESQPESEQQGNRVLLRHQFFDTVGHIYREYEGNWPIDKVPYLWDFGFLLCRQKAWDNTIRTGNQEVLAVWENLSIHNNGKFVRREITWTEFLKACQVVGNESSSHEKRRNYPFDVSMVATESFSCLILEIWGSAIAEKHSELNNVFPPNRHDKPPGMSLVGLLEEHRGCLWQSWTNLLEYIAPDQFAAENNVFKSRAAYTSAVATRHWYSTAATAVQTADPSDPLVPLGLPGKYSVRGDWFLAVADGSRSRRLAELTMDILCSRRGNIERLQRGLGLPVRGTRDSDAKELWTPLFRHMSSPQKERVMYSDLLKLGAVDAMTNAEGRPGFRWIWRSQIPLYDRHARIWQRWLSYMMTDRFWVFRDNAQSEFEKECTSLVSRLKRATFLKEPFQSQ